MFVDWFTFIAQIVNFLILVWLLKRFLYGPILEAIDEREKKISGQFLEARAKTEAAVKEREEFKLKKEELELSHDALLTAAIGEADGKRQQMIDEARIESDTLRARLHETLEKERHDLEREIIRRIKLEAFETARRALSDLAGSGLEERMCEVFIERLRGLGDDAKERMANVVKSNGAVVLRSAFELTPARRAEIESAFGETFAAGIKIRYETIPEIVCGIELTAGGYRLVWSIADYTASLEKSVGLIFSEKNGPEMKTDEQSA